MVAPRSDAVRCSGRVRSAQWVRSARQKWLRARRRPHCGGVRRRGRARLWGCARAGGVSEPSSPIVRVQRRQILASESFRRLSRRAPGSVRPRGSRQAVSVRRDCSIPEARNRSAMARTAVYRRSMCSEHPSRAEVIARSSQRVQSNRRSMSPKCVQCEISSSGGCAHVAASRLDHRLASEHIVGRATSTVRDDKGGTREGQGREKGLSASRRCDGPGQ